MEGRRRCRRSGTRSAPRWRAHARARRRARGRAPGEPRSGAPARCGRLARRVGGAVRNSSFAGGAAAAAYESLGGLEVDTERMRANLDASGGLVLAERVASALAGPLGRGAAHELVADAACTPAFRDALLADARARRAPRSSTRSSTRRRIWAPRARSSTARWHATTPRRKGGREARERRTGREARPWHGGAARGARRRPRRPRDRAHDAVHGGLPGLHHALRLGRDLVAARPRPSNAELRHAHRSRRERAGARARDARPRRARNGLTPNEIGEVLLHCAVYCGVPAANGAFAIAQRVVDEETQ